MSTTRPERVVDEYEHVAEKQDRDTATDRYVFHVHDHDDDESGLVATEPNGDLEARGETPAAAIANYAQAVDARNSRPDGLASEADDA